MRINKLIQQVTKEYMPVKKLVVEAQKAGRELTAEEMQNYFELNTTLELYKIIKGMFMEEVTKNKEMNAQLIKNGVLTTHTEQAEKDGKVIDVEVVDQSMDERIDMVPENVQLTVLEKMVKAHKENIIGYKNCPELLKKEEFELKIIEQYLPKEATKDDIMEYINEYYPNGIERKGMGRVIGEVKKAFERADGKLIAECVQSKLV